VTAWPERLALTGITVAFVGLVVWGMRRGWTNRNTLQQGIAHPSSVPANFVSDLTVSGRYIASTAAGAWLTRITAHGLGLPSRCVVRVGKSGIEITRVNQIEIFIPQVDVIAVKADRAIAGRAFEKDGIVIVTWRLGDIFVDTGFRADTTEQHVQLLQMMTQENAA